MEGAGGDDLQPKCVDISLPVPPEVTRTGYRIFARFTLLHWPLRIKGCALVETPDGRHMILTPDKRVKVNLAGQSELVDIAFQAMRDAAQRIGGASQMSG